MSNLRERIIEELIYERVRTQIDLLQLGWFEADLDASIGRVLGKLDDPGAPSPGALAELLIDEAWTRVEAEWRQQRRRPQGECPLCEAEPPIDVGFDTAASAASSAGRRHASPGRTARRGSAA